MKMGSSNLTMYFEGKERVYPCHCGQTHRGDYAGYDYGHHNCLHETDLIGLPDKQAICPDCGMSWAVKEI